MCSGLGRKGTLGKRISSSSGMLLEESFQRRSIETARRASSCFPILEGTQFCWQAGGNKYVHGLRLTDIVGFAPGFKAFDDGSNSFLV